jgi:hypothetical protein
MSVVVTCPSCSKRVKVPEKLAGKKCRCPLCKTVLVVQTEDQPSRELETPRVPDAMDMLASAAGSSGDVKSPARPSRPAPAARARWLTLMILILSLASATGLGIYFYLEHQRPAHAGAEWESQNKETLKRLHTEAAALLESGKAREAFEKYDQILERVEGKALADPELIAVVERASQARRRLAGELAKSREAQVTSANTHDEIRDFSRPGASSIFSANVIARSPATSAPVPTTAPPLPGPPEESHPPASNKPIELPALPAATQFSAPADEGSRLKQLFDVLLQQGTNALAAGDAPAALDSFGDAKLVLDRRVKAKSGSYNSPEHVALLHGFAIAYQLAQKPERASPLFEENTPLDRACKADNASRQLLITRGFLDATQGYLAMRTVVRLSDYLKRHPQDLDSDLMDVLITALVRADERVQNRALMLDPAIKLYDEFNAKLEATRPGKKRWGIKWVSPAEYQAERSARDGALKAWQKSLDVVADRTVEVKDAERYLENAKKGGTASKARAAAASEALANARRRLSDAQRAADEARAKIPPVPILTRDDFKRLVAPSPGDAPAETAVALAQPAGKANQPRVISNEPLRLGGSEPTKIPPKAVVVSDTSPPAPAKAPVFDPPAAAPPTRRTYSRSMTGFAVAPDLILTSSAVNGAQRVVLEFPGAPPVEGAVERAGGDLALVRLRGRAMSYLNLAETFDGGPVQCPAYPDLSIFGVTLETLAGRANAPKADEWTVSLSRHPRLAGSPIIAGGTGDLVGVVTARREDPLDRLPATPIEKIKAFLGADLPKQTCATPKSAPVVQISAMFER